MLKKLVKYGNSNALILDKAILELLEIEEGATIKIKTDGKSIILTPHSKATSEKINETFTHNRANIEAPIKELLKNSKGVHKNKREKLEKELPDLIQTYQNLVIQLAQNPDFAEEVSQISGQAINPSSGYSPEYMEAYKAIRHKYAPKITKLEKKIASFQKLIGDDNNAPTPEGVNEKQQKAMEKEFAAHFKKYSNIQKLYGELLNNPEYQHKAQLIAEKYNSDQNSSEYLNAIDELHNTYHPSMGQFRKELRAISEKYSKAKTK